MLTSRLNNQHFLHRLLSVVLVELLNVDLATVLLRLNARQVKPMQILIDIHNEFLQLHSLVDLVLHLDYLRQRIKNLVHLLVIRQLRVVDPTVGRQVRHRDQHGAFVHLIEGEVLRFLQDEGEAAAG